MTSIGSIRGDRFEVNGGGRIGLLRLAGWRHMRFVYQLLHRTAAIGSRRPTRDSLLPIADAQPGSQSRPYRLFPARRQETCLKSQTAGFGMHPRIRQTDAVKIVSASGRQSAAVDVFPGLEAQV